RCAARAVENVAGRGASPRAIESAAGLRARWSARGPCDGRSASWSKSLDHLHGKVALSEEEAKGTGWSNDRAVVALGVVIGVENDIARAGAVLDLDRFDDLTRHPLPTLDFHRGMI